MTVLLLCIYIKWDFVTLPLIKLNSWTTFLVRYDFLTILWVMIRFKCIFLKVFSWPTKDQKKTSCLETSSWQRFCSLRCPGDYISAVTVIWVVFNRASIESINSINFIPVYWIEHTAESNTGEAETIQNMFQVCVHKLKVNVPLWGGFIHDHVSGLRLYSTKCHNHFLNNNPTKIGRELYCRFM